MWEARDTATQTASLMASEPSGTTHTPSSNENTMSQGANYFFGFLITFIVLLLIFVACGVGTRRRRSWFARRRRPGGDTEPWDPARDDPSLQPKPAFWEAWVVVGSPAWSTMTVSQPGYLILRMLTSASQHPVRSWDGRSHYRLHSWKSPKAPREHYNHQLRADDSCPGSDVRQEAPRTNISRRAERSGISK